MVRDNLDALIDGEAKQHSRYDGYSSCPLVTKQGELHNSRVLLKEAQSLPVTTCALISNNACIWQQTLRVRCRFWHCQSLH